MLHLYDRATMAHALTLDLDPQLHRLLSDRIGHAGSALRHGAGPRGPDHLALKVIGVPHPSYHAPNEALKAALASVAA